jgi:outer membrane receptor protein involved in Fe transport
VERREGFAFAVCGVIAATAAYGQQQVQAQGQATAQELEEIVVTGSRIPRPDFESSAPVVTVPGDRFEQTPAGTIEETLARLPQFLGGTNASSNRPFNNALAGQALLSLRGLNSYESLVLVDGRRLVPANGYGSPDTNVIPGALVQRTEVLTGGASAVYGTDAMAGVVNIHLLDHFEGVAFAGNWSQTGHGDGERYRATLTAGTNFADGRGAVMGSVGYYDRSLVTQADRKFSQTYLEWYGRGTGGVGPGGQFLPLASTNIPEGRTIWANNRPSESAFEALFQRYGYDAGTLPYPQDVGFNADGSVFTMGDGETHGSVANFRGTWDPLTINDTAYSYNASPGQAMQMPLERTSVFANGSFEFNASVELYVQGLYSDYTVDQLLAPTPIWNAFVPVTNPYISPDLRFLLESRGNPAAPFLVAKRTLEVGPRAYSNQYGFYQLALGLRGSVLEDWKYNGYVQYGQNEQTFAQTGNVSLTKWEELLWAPDGGVALCGGADPFGYASISRECAEYMDVDVKNTAKVRQLTSEVTLTGSPLEMPAGTVNAVLGLFYQKNWYEQHPGPANQQTTPDGRPDVAGSFFAKGPMSADDYNVDAYAEVLVPLLDGLSELELGSLKTVLGYRWSDYASAGTTSAYKGELLFEPVDAVHLRGSFQRAVRAPSVYERYEAQWAQDVGVPQPDPCSYDSDQRTGPDGARVTALCLDQGVPASEIDVFLDDSGTAPGFVGGNPDLIPEEGTTWTVGMVLDAPFGSAALKDVQVSVDWWSIRITDAIRSVAADFAVSACYDPTYNPGFSAKNEYCTWFSRESDTGLIYDAYSINRNLSVFETSGIDVQFDWHKRVGPGKLGATWLVSWLQSWELQWDPQSPPEQYRGTACCPTLPEWKWNFDASYRLSRFTIDANWTYLGHVDGSWGWDPEAPSFQVPVRNYLDLTGSYVFGAGTLDGLRLSVGISNLLDEQPPIFPSHDDVNSDGSTYDLLGRTFWINVNYVVRPGPN